MLKVKFLQRNEKNNSTYLYTRNLIVSYIDVYAYCFYIWSKRASRDFIRSNVIKFYSSKKWKKPFYFSILGKTRTRDKYRIVYTDRQRYELENEFAISKYISIPRKAALSSTLGLSERQVREIIMIVYTIFFLVNRLKFGFKIVVQKNVK